MRAAIVIVDLDGTLADVSRFEFLVAGKRKKFDLFHEAALSAPANQTVKAIIRALRSFGFTVILVSGRPFKWKSGIENWLRLNQIQIDGIHLRGDLDLRSDTTVKTEFIRQLSDRGEIVLAIDDNPKAISAWRNGGIPTVVVPGSLNEFGKRYFQ